MGTTGGDGTWNQGILVENNNATAGEPTVAFKNASTASNFWFTGLNQSANYDIAYGTTFTNGNTFLRIETGGNMGIGTVSPSTQLHTTGGVRFQNLSGTGSRFVMADANGNLSTNTAVGSGIVSGSGTTNYISKWTPDGNTQGNSQIFDNGTNLGIGTSSPLVKFDVRGSSLFGAGFGPTASTSNNIINLIVGINTSGASNGIAFYENTGGFGMKLGYDGSGSGTANKMAIYSDSDSELFTFQNGGNLGIGTTSPNAKLDIKDHTDTGIMLYLTDDNNSSGELAHKAIQIQTQGTMQSWVATNGDVFYNGSMGIGTESTLSDLDIEQSGGSASNQGTGGINLRNGTYHWRMYNSNNYVRFNYSSDDGVTYTPKAYISPTDGSWNQLSDISLKHNIEELNPVINQIKQINVIQYNYIDNPDGCSKVLGVSANDVQKIFPQIVSSENDKGIVGIDYSKFGVISIKAIQEQQQIIEQQQQQIDLLQQQIDELRSILQE